MQFSPEQDGALKAVSDWLKAGQPQLFRLFGYAGTGKTTLARRIAEDIDGTVQFAAFTGKAAQVLRSHGAANARTIHSLIYRPRGEETIEDEDTGTKTVSPTFSLNRSSTISKAKLIIVDECSMVDEALGLDLLSFGRPVLVLGDPGQLPPISGGGYFTDAEPDYLLTDVHRQARDNPIIDLAMKVRNGEHIDFGRYGESRVIGKEDIDSDTVMAADQVLVGRNRTRRLYNGRIRSLLDHSDPLPVVGDRMVCLRNDTKKGLLNGSQWRISSRGKRPGLALSLLAKSLDEGPTGPSARLRLLKKAFEEPGADIPWPMKRRYDDFDFAYALTVHKSQGSQWDDIVLFDESFAFGETRARWLYTAITRAVERITIVR